MCSNSWDFNTMSDPFLIDFFKAIRPGYQPPSAYDLANSLSDTTKVDISMLNGNALQKTASVKLELDEWNDENLITDADRMLVAANVSLLTGDWVAVRRLPQTTSKTTPSPLLFVGNITRIEREEDKFYVNCLTLETVGQQGVYVLPAKEDRSCCTSAELVKLSSPTQDIFSVDSGEVRVKFTFNTAHIDCARRCLGISITSVC